MDIYEEVRRRWLAGQRTDEIAQAINKHRSRVGQIRKELGLGRDSGGLAIRRKQGLLKKQARALEIKSWYLKIWGLTKEERKSIARLYGQAPFTAFQSHRATSRHRGIAFRMSFKQWWDIWHKSGKWSKRGVNGYVMTRVFDKGAYEPSNVRIQTSRANRREYHQFSKKLRQAREIVSSYERTIHQLVRT